MSRDIKNYKSAKLYTPWEPRGCIEAEQPVSNGRDTAATEKTAPGADLHTEGAGWSSKPMYPRVGGLSRRLSHE
jgi:hypothetical protein